MKSAFWRSRSLLLAASLTLTISLPLVTLWAENAPEEWKAPAAASEKKNPIPADENSVAKGKTIYAQSCLVCHGALGKGDGPAAQAFAKSPGDLSKPAMWEQTDGALFWKITVGRPPMPAFEQNLNEDQRWQVVNFLRTLAPKPAASQPTSQPSQ